MDSSLDSPLLGVPVQNRESWWTRFSRCICCCNRRGVIYNKNNISWKPSHLWARIRDKLHGKRVLDHSYTVLLDLYSHKSIESDIKDCKLSPDNDSVIRDDLEFYIPQLWYDLISNFLLFGDPKEAENLLIIILELCKKSFYFAHRVIWFLSSIDFTELESSIFVVERLIDEIKLVSEDSRKLCLGQSKRIEKLLEKFDCYDKELLTRETLDAIEDYRVNYKNCKIIGIITPQCIPLDSFFIKSKENSFNSTPLFFSYLFKISTTLNSKENKLAFLRSELKSLNSYLPASVYLPFNNEDLRNCCVLHIPLDEVHIYETKESNTFRISIEVFCPYKEMSGFRRSRAGSFSLISEISTCTNELGDFDKKEVIEICKVKKTLTVVNEEKFHNRSCSMISEGVSMVYGQEDNGNKYETFYEQKQKVKEFSPFRDLKTWNLINVIVKTGENLRQEQLAMQLITFFRQTFIQKKIHIWLRPYEIIATHPNCGIIECVPDALSIHTLKSALPANKNSLLDYFNMKFNGPNSISFKNAQKDFAESLAGYSLVCYILQIKDRHNQNILVDHLGHILHIDFGFMLGNSPGGNLNFESAPFKLTEEFEQLLGGRRSKSFNRYRRLCVEGFRALKDKAEQIILMLEMMQTGSGSNLPCFSDGENVIKEFRDRLIPKPNMTRGEYKKYVNSLIDESLGHWTTNWYDRFQYYMQGIIY